MRFALKLVALIVGSALVVVGCGRPTAAVGVSADRPLTIGFAQFAEDTSWRAANTRSIKEAAGAAGVDLVFSESTQQTEQIASLRSYIQQGVDVIALSPAVMEGWDEVLGEARTAGIPVILVGQSITTADVDLYRTLLSSNYLAQGRAVGRWLINRDLDGPATVVELKGTSGSEAADARHLGFRDAIRGTTAVELVASETGDLTREGGRQLMTEMLQNLDEVDAVFAHSDDMALGAVEALEAADHVPGGDVLILSVEGARVGLAALAVGKMNFIIESDPMVGEKFVSLARDMIGGKNVPHWAQLEDETFDQHEAEVALPGRTY